MLELQMALLYPTFQTSSNGLGHLGKEGMEQSRLNNLLTLKKLT